MQALLKNTQRTNDINSIILDFIGVIGARCNEAAYKALGRIENRAKKLRSKMKDYALDNGIAYEDKDDPQTRNGYTVDPYTFYPLKWNK